MSGRFIFDNCWKKDLPSDIQVGEKHTSVSLAPTFKFMRFSVFAGIKNKIVFQILSFIPEFKLNINNVIVICVIIAILLNNYWH